jgi:hypothetical protein
LARRFFKGFLSSRRFPQSLSSVLAQRCNSSASRRAFLSKFPQRFKAFKLLAAAGKAPLHSPFTDQWVGVSTHSNQLEHRGVEERNEVGIAVDQRGTGRDGRVRSL